MHHFLPLSATLSLAAVLTACSPLAVQQQVSGSLQVTSTSAANGALADNYGCKGNSVSPQIAWSNPPPGTKSLALIMEDKDLTVGHIHRHYVAHWLVFDMPADKRELTEGQPAQALPDGTQQGKDDSQAFGYTGPCPGAGSTHHYALTVYALDSKLGLPADTTIRQLVPAMEGHVLAQGQLAVSYGH
jgi:Raf kinase inhibitor-like YbhB/YbcL family protein